MLSPHTPSAYKAELSMTCTAIQPAPPVASTGHGKAVSQVQAIFGSFSRSHSSSSGRRRAGGGAGAGTFACGASQSHGPGPSQRALSFAGAFSRVGSLSTNGAKSGRSGGLNGRYVGRCRHASGTSQGLTVALHGVAGTQWPTY
jgi:hypothetical protein